MALAKTTDDMIHLRIGMVLYDERGSYVVGGQQ